MKGVLWRGCHDAPSAPLPGRSTSGHSCLDSLFNFCSLSVRCADVFLHPGWDRSRSPVGLVQRRRRKSFHCYTTSLAQVRLSNRLKCLRNRLQLNSTPIHYGLIQLNSTPTHFGLIQSNSTPTHSGLIQSNSTPTHFGLIKPLILFTYLFVCLFVCVAREWDKNQDETSGSFGRHW